MTSLMDELKCSRMKYLQVKYSIKKDKMLLPIASGTVDLCAELERNHEKLKTQKEFYGVKDRCPFEKVTCGWIFLLESIVQSCMIIISR